MTTISVNAALDTLHIRIPMQFSRRSSRKMIVGPDGKTISEMIDAEADNTDYTFISALGKAFSWQRMLDEGKYQTPKELAEKEKVEVTHMYRVMRLTLLAPDIIEAVLNGKQPRTLTLQNVVRGFPISWQEQRKVFGFLTDT
ncbi:MAG TPA: hypothetical protein DHW10_07675 [Rhodospirillaceae bacterium]|jgi:hypothetical protein|nr:hypothetical protein [Micavibrio sp.]HCK33405.1 hypothetical protein [Rhodospirillaceae bacterium]|tara:strand:+ start:2210 stop:2635 length:426 start_codon:yes stop_codon:yes gene_type:complete